MRSAAPLRAPSARQLATRLGAVALSGLVLSACCRRPPPPRVDPEPASSALAGTAGSAPPEPAEASRCVRPADDKVFTFGESQGAVDDEVLIFGVEVGQAVATAEGFAVGALRPTSKGMAAVVLLLDAEAGHPSVVQMALALGDTPPPRVAARNDLVVAALLEAGASGRHLRLGRLEKGAVAWGPTFDQGRDESLAFDVAIGETRAIAVWDDDETKPDRGVVRLSTFVAKSLSAPTVARTITLPQTDAESPRVVPRPGGFWLVYVARRPEKTDENAREQAEAPEHRWLEAIPLDENGAGQGLPRRLTPESGHVLTFSLAEGSDGTAVVVYRDDDLPSGGGGGVLARVLLRGDGASSAQVLADSDLGAGVPALLPGWLAIADVSSATRLARIDQKGDLVSALEREPVFGTGAPIAARGSSLLVVKPVGRAVRLFVTDCK